MDMTLTENSGAPFRDAVDQHILAAGKRTLGENGMPEYSNSGVGSKVLALSQMVRGGDPKPLVREIIAGDSSSDIADLVVLLFATRNTRGGKGEKALAHEIFFCLIQEFPETCSRLLPLFPHYGYWKDLLLLMAVEGGLSDSLVQATLQVIRDRLQSDMKAVEQYKKDIQETFDEEELRVLQRKGPSISLLAKWLPREGSSLDKKTRFVSLFAPFFWNNESNSAMDNTVWQSRSKAQYRQTIAQLTAYLALPEVLLAAQREDEIQFAKLASKATMGLRKVFLNETKHGKPRSENPKRIRLAERFRKYVVDKGLKGRQLNPHEIVHAILNNYKISSYEELVLNAQWKDLWRGVAEQAASSGDGVFNPTRMVPMADVSGSMSGVPMEVSIALSIGLSEITHEAFQNMVLTFSSTPTWHRLNPEDSIVQKVRSLASAPWGMSTNFEAAYDLILATAEAAQLSRADLPSLVVFSDMQFDQAAGNYGSSMTTMHEHLKEKVRLFATRLGWDDTDPTPIVYWNLRNTGGHPVDKDTEGTVLLAGFSPSLLKLILSGEALSEDTVEVVQADGTVVTEKIRVTPEQILRKMLDDEAYDPVRSVLATSVEGALTEFEVLS